jgi:hypothetical protein
MTEKKPGRPPVKPELKARTRSIPFNDVQWNNLQKKAKFLGLSIKDFLTFYHDLNQRDETL